MKNASVAILILGLGLGLAGGYLLAVLQEEAPRTALPEGGRDGARETAREPARPAPEAGRVAPIETRGPEPAEVERFVAQFEVPGREPGDGRIEGSVHDVDGQALRGVLIRAVPRERTGSRARRRRQDRPDDRPLSERVSSYVDRMLWEQAETREARSDSEGRYVVAGLRDGEYRLQAWAEGFRVRASVGSTWNLRPGTRVDWVAEPLVAVRIDVVDAAGEPVDEAQIELQVLGGQRVTRNETWSRDVPELQLEEGSFRIVAKTSRPREMQSGYHTLVIDADAPPEPLRLELKVANVVKGRLVLPPGDARDSFRVHLMRLSSGEPGDPAALSSAEPHAWIHAHNGFTFRFGDLEPGRYLLGATSNGGGRVLVHTELELTEGTIERDLEIPPVEAGEHVVVTVLSPEGTRLRNLEFRERSEYSHGSSTSSAEVSLRPDGTWLFAPNQEYAHDPGAKTWLEIRCPRFGTKSVRVEPKTQPELTVRFEEPAELVVTIQGARGNPDVDRISLAVRSVDAGRRHHTSREPVSLRRMDEEDRLTFSPVVPGAHVLSLEYRGQERWSSWSIARKEIEVAPGSNPVSIAVPVLHSLTVAMPEGAAGVRLNLTRFEDEESLSISNTVDEKLEASFRGVPAGTYQLQCWGNVRGRMKVTVPGPSRIPWEPQVDNAIRVHVTEATGVLAAQGFRDGDVIVAIDGARLAGGETALRLGMMRLLRGEPTPCVVSRGGREVPLSVTLAGDGDWRANLGGNLLPTHHQP